jgi:hypothetical protein
MQNHHESGRTTKRHLGITILTGAVSTLSCMGSTCFLSASSLASSHAGGDNQPGAPAAVAGAPGSTPYQITPTQNVPAPAAVSVPPPVAPAPAPEDEQPLRDKIMGLIESIDPNEKPALCQLLESWLERQQICSDQ